LDDDEVDVVLICTRHNLHAPLTIEAAEKGKAVFVEKPIGLTHKEVYEVLDAIKSTNIPYIIGYNRRFSPTIKRAKELIKSGNSPVFINYRVNAGYLPSDHWAVGFKEGGGRIIGEACHMFDVINYLVGSKVTDYCVNTIESHQSKYSNSDNIAVILKYENGSVGTLTYTSMGSSKMPKEYIEIFYEGKSLIVNDFKELILFDEIQEKISYDHVVKGHYEEMLDFAKFLLGEKQLEFTLEEMESAARISIDIDLLVRQFS